MSEHFIVAIDHGHLRIFAEQQPAGQTTPGLQEVQAMDFPAGKQSYADRDTDVAGRFSSSKHQSRGEGNPTARTGMSIDERLPMQREEDRRRAKEIAAQIDLFFQRRPDATWDFAAGPQLNGAVLESISPAVRQRVRRSITKDLVRQPVDSMRMHFSGA
jgi:hypothetical protein